LSLVGVTILLNLGPSCEGLWPIKESNRVWSKLKYVLGENPVFITYVPYSDQTVYALPNGLTTLGKIY